MSHLWLGDVPQLAVCHAAQQVKAGDPGRMGIVLEGGQAVPDPVQHSGCGGSVAGVCAHDKHSCVPFCQAGKGGSVHSSRARGQHQAAAAAAGQALRIGKAQALQASATEAGNEGCKPETGQKTFQQDPTFCNAGIELLQGRILQCRLASVDNCEVRNSDNDESYRLEYSMTYLMDMCL